MADVFISYCKEDLPRIKPIVDALLSIGITVWYDKDIETSSRWDEEIERELDDARVVLVCWSRQSVRSRFVKKEAHIAEEKGTLIPCLIEKCKIPPLLAMTQAEDISGWTGAPNHPGWRKIIDRVSAVLKRPGLPSLLDVRATGNVSRLISWAQAFPDDSYAIKMWEFQVAEERRRFDGEMRSTRDKISAFIKRRDEMIQARLAECTKSFETWLVQIKTASHDARPQPEALLAELDFPRSSQPTPEVEIDHDQANENARSTMLFRWGVVVASCILGVIAGAGYRAFFNSPNSSEIISSQRKLETKLRDTEHQFEAAANLAAKASSLQSKLDEANNQASQLKSEKERLAQDVANDQSRIADLESQLRALQSKLNDANNLVSQLTSEKERLAQDVAKDQLRIADLESRLRALQNKLNDPNNLVSQLTLEKTNISPPSPTAPPKVPPARPNSASGQDYRTNDNRDIRGEDIRTLKHIDLQNCKSACRNEPRCQAYSFDKWNQFCFLKASITVLRLDPRSTAGIRQGLPAPPAASASIQMERYRGKLFSGEGYRTLVHSQFEACETVCQRDQACVAYTFQKEELTCRLFDSTGEYIGNKQADSGIKRQTP